MDVTVTGEAGVPRIPYSHINGPNYAVISIYSFDNHKPAKWKRFSNCSGIFYAQFDDINPQIYDECRKYEKFRNLILFSDKMADDIAEYVNRVYPKVEEIICQCEAGVSRSAAIAKAICDTYSLKDTQFQTDLALGCFCPNKFVYQKMIEAFERMRSTNGH